MEQVLDCNIHPSGVQSVIDNFLMNKFLNAAAVNDRNDNILADNMSTMNRNAADNGNNSFESGTPLSSLCNPTTQLQNGVNTSASLWRTFSNFSQSSQGLCGDRALRDATAAQPIPKNSPDQAVKIRDRGSLSSESAAVSLDQSSDVDSDTAVNSPQYEAAGENGQSASRDEALHSPPFGVKSDSASSDVNPMGSIGQNGKPPHSYIALISMAILSTSSRRMLLGDIYSYIMNTFPYYNNKEKAWRNSIRHNLSLNECFIKAGRSDTGKGHYWTIHHNCIEDFARGDFRRRQARRRARKNSSSTSVTSLHDGLNDNYYTMGSHYGAELFRSRMLDVSPSLGLGTVRGGDVDCAQFPASASVGVFGSERFGSAFSHLLPETYHSATDPGALSSLLPTHQSYLTQSPVSAIRSPAGISSCASSVFSPLPSSQLCSHSEYRPSSVYPTALSQMAYPWCMPAEDTRSYNPSSSTPSPKGELSFSGSDSCPSTGSPDSVASPPNKGCPTLHKDVNCVARMCSTEISDTPRAVTRVSLAGASGLHGTAPGSLKATAELTPGLSSVHDAKDSVQALQDAAIPPFILPTTRSTVPSPATPRTSPGVVDPTRNVSWLPSPPRTCAASLALHTEASRIPFFMDSASSFCPFSNQGSAVSVDNINRW